MTEEEKKRRGAPVGSKNAQKGKKPLDGRVSFRVPKDLENNLKLIANHKGIKLGPMCADILAQESLVLISALEILEKK